MLTFVTTLLLPLAQQSSTETAFTAPPPQQACGTEVFAAFDFWVGEWDVYPRANQERLVAHSRIERLHSGCAIRETWMPLSGAGGSSLSNMEPDTGRWHQTWIGSQPGRVEFEGGPIDGQMVLTGYWSDLAGPGLDGLVRMTYSVIAPGEVRQYGQASMDHGVTWSDSFDFIYKRRSEPLP